MPFNVPLERSEQQRSDGLAGDQSDGEGVQRLPDRGRTVPRLGPGPRDDHQPHPRLPQPQPHLPGRLPAHQEAHGGDARREAVRLLAALHLRQVRGVLPEARKGNFIQLPAALLQFTAGFAFRKVATITAVCSACMHVCVCVCVCVDPVCSDVCGSLLGSADVRDRRHRGAVQQVSEYLPVDQEETV